MERLSHRIGSQDEVPVMGEYLPTFNPYTAEPGAEVARGTEGDVDRAVAAASRALAVWKKTTPSARASLLWRLSEVIADHAEELARLETRDIGKVIREMRGQMVDLPRWYQYFAGQCHALEGSVIPLDKRSVLNYTRRDPFGVIGVIPPFNSPVLLTSFALAPALAAGNAVVVKPSQHASTAVL